MAASVREEADMMQCAPEPAQAKRAHPLGFSQENAGNVDDQTGVLRFRWNRYHR